MHFHFTIPSSVAFAPGSAETVGHLLLGFEVSKVLCIYDSGVKKAGLADAVLHSLKAAKLEVTIWDAVEPNPTDTLVEEGAQLAKEAGIEAIVAVGGGSVIDAAKAVSILMTNESPINQYDGINLVKNAGIQVVAIPTTAGTASEVTAFTVITDTQQKKKMVIGGQNVGARVALMDPHLTLAAPPALTAATGMGALAHAIEAYLSVAASIPTDINATKAIQLLFQYLPEAVRNGSNLDARNNILLGSMLAGFAYNSAILGLAHSMSHPLCIYSGISHGLANAAVLPYVIEYNGQAVPDRVKNVGLAMGLEIQDLAANEAVAMTVAAIRELSRSIGIPTLKELGVSRDDFEKIALDSLKEISTIFNPRNPSKEDVIGILEKAY
ncbi:MAG: iron-containing alcohol dehydrogenase [Geobacteraceae bacterium]|nr:iron-containing alcohol dehydrogenase [Geobacteraceae bacterium]